MTILIAEDEARSAKLVQAILLSYPFFVYSPESFCLPTLFPAYRWWPTQVKFLFSFLYIILLEWITINLLVFARAFLEFFLVWLLFWGIPMYDYFGLLLHRLLLGTTTSTTFGYYHWPSILLTSIFAQNFLFWRFGKFTCNFILSISIHWIMLTQKNGIKNILRACNKLSKYSSGGVAISAKKT